MLREAPELLVTVLVERVADAQVEGRRRALRVAGLLHPDEAAACLLLAALPLAISTLVELTGCNQHPAVRLGAANSVGRLWAKHVEEVAVQDQISALEGQVAELLEQLDEQRRQGWRP